MFRYFVAVLFVFSLLALGCGGHTKPAQDGAKNGQPTATPEKFVLAGSGANLPITAKLAEAYLAKTGVAIELPGSIGSNGAVNAVRAGSLELGLVSRPLTDKESAEGLKAIPYAQIAAVFGGHAEVPDTAFSSQDILAILRGTKTTWADGSKMYVFVREPSDSANQQLYEQIPGYEQALREAIEDRRWQVIYRDSDMGDIMTKTKGSFGLINMLEVARSSGQIKPMVLDGVAPTPENIANGSYMPVLTLSFLYKGELTARAASFVAFASSSEARKIMVQAGVVPAGR
ncbi:MAG: substrate-binding domain-containing protein [Negativicutes bacterium]|nr:substrate-binding domain-containing protein [Negativicutes bacterium]